MKYRERCSPTTASGWKYGRYTTHTHVTGYQPIRDQYFPIRSVQPFYLHDSSITRELSTTSNVQQALLGPLDPVHVEIIHFLLFSDVCSEISDHTEPLRIYMEERWRQRRGSGGRDKQVW